jgi:hypothetical protein
MARESTASSRHPSGSSRIARRILVAASIWAACATGALPAAAAPVVPNDTTEARRWAEHTRVFIGMWSTHLDDIGEGLSPNYLIGVAWRGYFGATFINSFGDRSIAVGLQRSFSPGRDAPVSAALGYRIGLITGYDERFFGIGDKLPALPFAQLMGTLNFRKFGIELNYSGIVAAFVLNWRP